MNRNWNRESDSENHIERSLRRADNSVMLDDAFFNRLHNKIMDGVAKTEIEHVSVWHRGKKALKTHWKSWSYPMGGTLALFALVSILTPQMSKFNRDLQRAGLHSDGQERIIQEALLDPDIISQTLIISQAETDFFMDVAQDSFENFSIEKINKLMGESRQ